MLSLIWKDVVAARRLLLFVVPLGAVQLAVLASLPGIYPIAALSFAALLAFGSIALEESQRTELLWNSLPVSRADFVSARYATTLIGITAALVFGWAIAQAATPPFSSRAAATAALAGLSAHAVMFGILALAAAAFLPLYFHFGAGRGLLLFSAVAVSALIIVSLLAHVILSANGYPSPFFDPEGWRATGPALVERLLEWLAPRFGRLLALFVGLAVITLGGSWAVARRLYEARDL